MTSVMIAVAVLDIVVVWIVAFRTDLSLVSHRRMMGMMANFNLIGRLGSPRVKTTINEARRRCRTCKHEDLCDRWLAGKTEVGNSFCPNAPTFQVLAQSNENKAGEHAECVARV